MLQNNIDEKQGSKMNQMNIPGWSRQYDKALLPEGCMLLQSFCDKDHKQQQVLQEPAQSEAIKFRFFVEEKNKVSFHKSSIWM